MFNLPRQPYTDDGDYEYDDDDHDEACCCYIL